MMPKVPSILMMVIKDVKVDNEIVILIMLWRVKAD